MHLRAFQAGDYPALAACYGATHPGAARSEAELRYLDSRQRPPYKHGRWLALGDGEGEGGEVLGWGEYTQHPSWYHPDKYDVALGVAPAHQRRGVGTALYDALLAALAPQRPQALRTSVLETCPAQVAFFTARGFAETQRSWLSTLSLQDFDPAPFAGVLEGLGARGYRVDSVAALEADPATLRPLYTFYQELVADVPRTQSFTPWTFEQFVAHRRGAPNLCPEGSFVISCGGTFAAVSELKRTADPSCFQTGLTAVRRAYRGQKLALAAKLCAIRFAKAQGARAIETRNASTNAAMLKVNDALGFVRGAADLELLKTLSAPR